MLLKTLLHTLFLSTILFFISCETQEKTKKITVSGRLIHQANSKSFEGVNLYFKSMSGVTSDSLGTAIVNNKGEFTCTYEIPLLSAGPYLKITFDTTFVASDKFQFLSLGEDWNKNFYVGDSASLVLKLNKDLLNTDTLYLITRSGSFVFFGPSTNQTLSILNLKNAIDEFYYNINQTTNKKIYYTPTGAPMVDTLLLNVIL